jgi:hypothetical protein
MVMGRTVARGLMGSTVTSAPGLEVSARHIQGGEQLLAHIPRQDRLGAEVDHARCRQAPDSEWGAEAQVLGEDDLPVAVRLLEDLAVGGIGLSISSTRQAAHARACIASCSSRYG